MLPLPSPPPQDASAEINRGETARPPPLFLDFETRSAVDLKTRGADVYAHDRSTDILCLGWALGEEEPALWIPDDPFPEKLRGALENGSLVIAHNYRFDRAIWDKVGRTKYGFPAIADSRWDCSMARAYYMGYPGALEKAALAFGLSAAKDMSAARVALRLSRPRRYREDGTPVWWDEFDKLWTVYRYCLQDVVVLQQLVSCLFPLSSGERELFLLDQKINDRGFQVDRPALECAVRFMERQQSVLDVEMCCTTDGKVETCSQVKNLTDFIRREYPGWTGGVSKVDLEVLLQRSDLPPVVRQVALYRQEAAKASTAKLNAMLNRSGADLRIRGAFQYAGANTHRWAGRGVQPQNFPRATLLTPAQIENTIHQLSEEIDLSYLGSPLQVLSDCLRGFIVPASGKKFFAGDFSSIEARVLAWLAGQEDVVRAFREKKDVYRLVAAGIFGLPAEKILDAQRMIGKVAVLSLGYGGGVGAFQKMSRNYGVKISDEEAERIKLRWREGNKRIVAYWHGLERAAKAAIRNSGEQFTVQSEKRKVVFMRKNKLLLCRLPSGRILFYPEARIEDVQTPWGETRAAITYMAEEAFTRRWAKQSTFPGFWAENVTQAVSRDILAEAMLRLSRAGWDIVLHAHDEVVCENVPSEKYTLKKLVQIMSESPPWISELPIEVKGWEGFSYRKG